MGELHASGTTEFAITDVPHGTHVIAVIVDDDDANPSRSRNR
jgi:phosphatidylethanolamine-binding protein (PEBP) family uncharacterized protein